MTKDQEQLQADLAILPIGTAIKLTGLTARQIRYYEANDLISIARSDSNQRLFSLNDLQRLMQIKRLLNDEHHLDQVRQLLAKMDVDHLEHHENRVRRNLKDEVWLASPFSRASANSRQNPFLHS